MQRKILNPYTKLEGYNCFGCSPDNHHGLQMKFIEEGDYIVSHWSPKNHLQGFHNILHGGVQATLIDEISSWFVQIKYKTSGVTSNLKVRYLKPVATNKGDISLRAELISKRRNLIDIKVELRDADNQLCAVGETTFFSLPVEKAKHDLFFPDYDEFFEEKK